MDDYAIVVPVANPQTVSRLIRTACLVARQFAGRIVVTNVVRLSDEVPSSVSERAQRMTKAYQLVNRAEHEARAWGIPCEGTVTVGEQIHEVIVDVAIAQRAKLIIAGFSERDEPSLQEQNFDRIIDALAARSPCHLVVISFRDGESFDRALVPLTSELNLTLTRDIVATFHYQAEACINFVHFARTCEEAEGMRQEVQGWLEAAGIADCGTVTVEISSDPTQAIVEASENYDVVIVGTPPLHTLRRKLFGSAAEYIANHAACTTLLVRAHESL